MISCLQSISHYNISRDQTALAFADYCAADNVYDLLHEILLKESLKKILVETIQQKARA
jgi:hypothetical protein